MPTSFYPKCTRQDKLRAIQPQCDDCRPSDSRSANNKQTVLAPLEMVIPPLSIRMKQTHSVARLWINSTQSCTFVQIAVPAGKTEILDDCRPSQRLRNDVVDSKRATCDPRLAPAISALITPPNFNTFPEPRWNRTHWGAWGPREEMSSPRRLRRTAAFARTSITRS